MNREELQKTYSTISTQELLEIIERKFDYTDTAVLVALEELSKRNISEQDIKSYKINQLDKVEKFIKQNILDDLSLFQKNLFFFIWLPLITFAFKQNFKDDGYVLKLKQANYYSLLGFASFILTGIVSGFYDLPNLTSVGIWIIAFLPAYGFDEFFNRQREIKRLKKLLDKKKDNEMREL